MSRLTARAIAFLFVFASAMTAASAQTVTLPDFSVLAQQNGPAVVNISTTQKLKKSDNAQLNIPNLPEDGPWGDLLRRFFGEQGQGGGDDGYDGQVPEVQSLGSGFIISSDGYILTNHHVIDGADEIIVRLNDRRELKAKVIGSDPRSDIALLKVKAKNLPTVHIGHSSDLKPGQWVMAIGSPFGFDHSVSVGVVSALGRSLPRETYVPFIQTDVAINPGNSGGPLFNTEGQVVGINSQIYSRTGGFMGLSFAIPIDVAMDVTKQLKERGYVTRGWLGVLIQDVTRELAESFNMKRPEGALVAQVMDKSPAAEAGIKVGDIILDYNGHSLAYSSDLPPLVGRTPIGSTAKLEVLRDGKKINLNVKIAELPPENKLKQERSEHNEAQTNKLGLSVQNISDDQRDDLGVSKNGVLITHVGEGPAAEAGLHRGDVVLKLNNVDIENAAQFAKVVHGLPNGRSVPILIMRQRSPMFLALKVPGG